MRTTGGAARARGAVASAAVALALAAGNPGAFAGADPAAAKPFVVSALGGGDATTITDALARAPAGTPILVRTGVYRETVTAARAVEIRADGADANGVVVEGTTGPAIRATGDGVVVKGLTLRVKRAGDAAPEAAVLVTAGSATLEGCVATTDAGPAVIVRGAETQIALTGCRLFLAAGEGLTVSGGSATLEKTSIEDARGNGIGLYDGAGLRGKEVVVSGCVGEGISVVEGSTLTLEGGQIRGNRRRGIAASGKKTAVTLKGVTFPGGTWDGVAVLDGARLEADACEWAGMDRSGVVVAGEGSRATLRTCRTHHHKSSGVLFEKQAQGLLEDCDVGSSEKVGVEVRGESEVTIKRCKLHEQKTGADLLVHDPCTVHVEGCELWGGAVPEVWAYDGAKVDVKSTTVHDAGDDGVTADTNAKVLLLEVTATKCKGSAFSAASAHLEAQRCVARDGTRGLRITQAAEVVLTGCEVVGSLEEGVLVEDRAHLAMTGGKVKDGKKDAVTVGSQAEAAMASVEVTGNRGSGIVVSGGTATVRECKIRKNTGVGASVSATGSGTFERCDLTDNVAGAWHLEDPTRVTRKGNRPAK